MASHLRTDAELEGIQRGLAAYFPNGSRFRFDGLVGRGCDALTFGIRRNHEGLDEPSRDQDGIPDRFVVKVVDWGRNFNGAEGDEEEEEREQDWDDDESRYGDDGGEHSEARRQLEHEKELLKQYRDSPHIVTSLDVTNDPLTRAAPPGVRAHRMRDWIYMEYVENGTLGQFIERVRRAGRTVPNSVLWGMFGCMVRFCLVMAHGVETERMSLDEVRRYVRRPGVVRMRQNTAHMDMHLDNIMVGDLHPCLDGQPGEHRLSPLLKLIDFGGAASLAREAPGNQRRPDAPEEGWERNVYDIGAAMTALLTTDTGIWDAVHGGLPQAQARVRVPCPGGHYNAMTAGGPLLDEGNLAPGVDPDLVALVCRCLYLEPDDRPGLHLLAHWVARKVGGGDLDPGLDVHGFMRDMFADGLEPDDEGIVEALGELGI